MKAAETGPVLGSSLRKQGPAVSAPKAAKGDAVGYGVPTGLPEEFFLDHGERTNAVHAELLCPHESGQLAV